MSVTATLHLLLALAALICAIWGLAKNQCVGAGVGVILLAVIAIIQAGVGLK